jgi:ribosomal-protein-alanine N-acetyltransferase
MTQKENVSTLTGIESCAPTAALPEASGIMVSLSIEVTSMAPADIPGVLEIERENHLEPWSEQSFRAEIDRKGSYALVAKTAGSPNFIAGYVCVWIVVDEVQILNLSVRKDQQGKGIGRQLLLQALREGCKQNALIATLEVRQSNTPARSLYAAVGFNEVRKRPGYYGVRSEPAIVMELEMDSDWRAAWMEE